MSVSQARQIALPRVIVRTIGALACVVLLAIGIAFSLGQLRLIGNAAPDFTLTDQDGQPWTLSHVRGHQAVALFFGYTHCPDVCPTTLAHLAQARRMLGADGADLRIVFVTVDAARDTPAVLKRYVSLFDPSVVGLTGDRERTAPVYAAYHVWHQVLPRAERDAGYLVSHSSAVYLIGRDGSLRGIADWGDAPTHLAAKFKELIS